MALCTAPPPRASQSPQHGMSTTAPQPRGLSTSAQLKSMPVFLEPSDLPILQPWLLQSPGLKINWSHKLLMRTSTIQPSYIDCSPSHAVSLFLDSSAHAIGVIANLLGDPRSAARQRSTVFRFRDSASIASRGSRLTTRSQFRFCCEVLRQPAI